MVSGGRKNFYQIGSIDDPDARANAISNMPPHLRVAHIPYGDGNAIFYFYQKTMTGDWIKLHKTVPMPIKEDVPG